MGDDKPVPGDQPTQVGMPVPNVPAPPPGYPQGYQGPPPGYVPPGYQGPPPGYVPPGYQGPPPGYPQGYQGPPPGYPQGYQGPPPGYPPGYQGPPPGYPPAPRGNSGLLLPALFALLVVVGAGVAGMYALHLGPFAKASPTPVALGSPSPQPTLSAPAGPSSSPVGSSQPSPSSAPSASSSTPEPPTITPSEPPSAPPSATPVPSPDLGYLTLMRHIPADVADKCGRDTPSQQGEVAAVTCEIGDISGAYSLFGDIGSLNAFYGQMRSNVGLERDSGSGCASADTWPSETSYTVAGREAGRVLCVQAGGQTVMLWKDDHLLVLGGISLGSDASGDATRLYNFWLNRAGPVEDARYDELLSHVPSAIKSSCASLTNDTSAQQWGYAAVAIAGCTSASGAITVEYALYLGQAAMQYSYDDAVSVLGVAVSSGNCGAVAGWPGEDGYSIEHQHAGRWVCSGESGADTIFWTDERLNIMSQAASSGDRATLIDFFYNQAGPNR